MTELLGLFAALIAAIFWGTYFVPLKKTKRPDLFQFHIIMSVGILLSTLLLIPVGFSFSLNAFGIAAGLIWSVGNILSIIAVRLTGLAKSAPIWMGIAILISFLWGVVFFKEILTSITFGLVGLILFIIGAPLVSSPGKDKKKIAIRGILIAAIAGIFFGTQLVPLKLSGLTAQEFLFSMSLGILISGGIIFLVRFRKIKNSFILHGLTSGIMWNIANLSSFFAVIYLGIAIGFPLTQLALLISTAWGLLYFKEVKGKNKIIKILMGAILIFVGGLFLAFAKII